MKKILAFLLMLLVIPPITAYAASCTSRHFVVRNTPAVPTTPPSTTPASTGEVEMREEIGPEGEEQEAPEGEDQAIPPESTTPPIFTGEVETPTTPPVFAIPTFTTPVSTDEVETEEQGNEVEQGETEIEEQEKQDETGEPEEPSEVEQSEPEAGEIEQKKPKEPEAAPEGELVEQAVFFGDDLNAPAYEVEMGEQSGEIELEEQGEIELEVELGGEPQEMK